jgi:hypothetical protein
MNFVADFQRHSGRPTAFLHDDENRHIGKTTGRGSTYPEPIPVQTNPASSISTAYAEEYSINTWQGEWIGTDTDNNRAGIKIIHCDDSGHCDIDVFGISDVGGVNCRRSGKIEGFIDGGMLSARICQSGNCEQQFTMSLQSNGDSLTIKNIAVQQIGYYPMCKLPSEIRPYIRQSKQAYIEVPAFLNGECYCAHSRALKALCTDESLPPLVEQAKHIPLAHVEYSWLIDNSLLNKCENVEDVSNCLEDGYREKIRLLEVESKRLTVYEEQGDIAEAKELSSKISGSYRRNSDIFKFIPVSDTEAYISIHTGANSSHQCNVDGIAEYEKVGGFVFQDVADNDTCLLTITEKKNSISLNDPTGNCRKLCGANGGFYGGFDTLQKQEITTKERQNAVENYQKYNLLPDK